MAARPVGGQYYGRRAQSRYKPTSAVSVDAYRTPVRLSRWRSSSVRSDGHQTPVDARRSYLSRVGFQRSRYLPVSVRQEHRLLDGRQRSTDTCYTVDVLRLAGLA